MTPPYTERTPPDAALGTAGGLQPAVSPVPDVAGRRRSGDRVHLPADPQLWGGHHRADPGGEGRAAAAGREADPVDAGHAGHPAEAQGAAAQVQGGPSEAERSDDEPVQGARVQPTVRLLPLAGAVPGP